MNDEYVSIAALCLEWGFHVNKVPVAQKLNKSKSTRPNIIHAGGAAAAAATTGVAIATAVAGCRCCCC